MDDGIRIQKTTLLLFVGLALAALAGTCIVWGAAAKAQQTGQPAIPDNPAGLSVPSPDGGLPGGQADVQDVYVRALKTGTYDKTEVTVRKGIPVRFHFTADQDAGCGRLLVVYGLNVKAVSQGGEESVVEFTPRQEGTYEYSCGMRMWGPGRLVVTR